MGELCKELVESFLRFLERSAAYLAYLRKVLQKFTSISHVEGAVVLVTIEWFCLYLFAYLI